MAFDGKNMRQWIMDAPKEGKAFPILSFPGVGLINVSVGDMAKNGNLQADCVCAIAERYDMLAAVSNMDLSVEAEAFGAEVRFDENEVPTVIGAVVNDMEEAEALRIPVVGEKRTGEYIKAIGIIKERITDRPIFAGVIGPFSLSGRLMDMIEIMCKCYSDPDEVHIVLKKATEFLKNYIQEFKKAGANGIVIAEPAAGILSPQLIGEFSSPYVSEIIKSCEDDSFVVIYHNCGNTIPLVKEILETGASALHFGNAIDLKEMLGLIPSDKIVMGNVDPATKFRNGTPESVREETLWILESCSLYENFIVSSGCDIPPQSPHANIESFFSTVKEFYKQK